MLRYAVMLLSLAALAWAQAALPGWSQAPALPDALTSGTAVVRVGALLSVAGIELGPEGTVATPYVDFHSSGTAGMDYDSRLIGVGGDGRDGHGDLGVVASRFLVGGTLKVARSTSGTFDRAIVAAFIANSVGAGLGGPPAQVLGYTPGLAAAQYNDIDSVATYTENSGRLPFFTVENPSFEVTPQASRLVMPSGRPLPKDQLAQLHRGMQLLTNHRKPWTAWIDTWDPEGRWVQVIEGFAPFGGVGTPGQDPTGSPIDGPLQVAFAPLTKVWLENANCFLGGPGLTGAFVPKECAGYELGMFNNLGRDHSYRGLSDPNGYSWGFDAVNLGANRSSSAHIARGNWDVGFHAQVAGRFGFLMDAPGPGDGFASVQTQGLAFAARPGGGESPPVWSVASDGTMQAAQMVLPDLPQCATERRPGHVCRRGRVLEVN